MSEDLKNYNFPQYPPEPLVKRAPRLDSDGIDLVSKFLLYEARKRISARDAMHHSYFSSIGAGVHNLLDGKYFFDFFTQFDWDPAWLLFIDW
jgi:cyclin-dependent kinase 17